MLNDNLDVIYVIKLNSYKNFFEVIKAFLWHSIEYYDSVKELEYDINEVKNYNESYKLKNYHIRTDIPRINNDPF